MGLHIPTGYPSPVSGFRSGLPARHTIPLTLDTQARFLYGAFKETITIPLFVLDDTGLSSTTAGAASPLHLSLHIPPYTRWLEWRVQTRRAGAILAQCVGALVPKIEVQAEPGASSRIVGTHWTPSQGISETLSNKPTAIDVRGTADTEREWRQVEVKVWISGGARLYAVEFEPLRLTQSGDTIAT